MTTLVRIEPPAVSIAALRHVPGLEAINLHPPAAGPEVELVFAGVPDSEAELRDRVEHETGCQPLAIAVRREL